MDATFIPKMVELVQLIASDSESLGYITYVFKRLETIPMMSKYIMMVRYPNWDSKDLQIGDIGFVHYEERRAGVDKWFDGKDLIPYNYNTIQFIKFVEKPKDTEINKYIM